VYLDTVPPSAVTQLVGSFLDCPADGRAAGYGRAAGRKGMLQQGRTGTAAFEVEAVLREMREFLPRERFLPKLMCVLRAMPSSRVDPTR